MKLTLTRDITKEECSWLDRDYKKGEEVYDYHGCVYGCVGFDGLAVTEVEDQTPFFELPKEALCQKSQLSTRKTKS